MIKDRKGKIVKEKSGKASLYFLYNTIPGRCVLKVLVNPVVSKAAGRFLDTKYSCFLIKPFIKKSKINMDEYEECEFKSFNQFFKRKIKRSARKMTRDKNMFISPADSKLSVYKISDDSLFKIKGSVYSTADFLNNEKLAREYNNGYCMIFRLAVDDYHRYCYIDDGTKEKNIFIKGELNTVRPLALEYCDVYKRNAREYTVLHTENFDDVVQTEVGAMFVGRIKNKHEKASFKRGHIKGYFEYGGSTIVLLVKEGIVEIDEDILKNSEEDIETRVKIGETIGRKADVSVG
ncbi:MAG: phosphatidylserine decarboxylase [Firmicutes bacterium]|nr:phosphatidylserine decarboxylase [Bacillota bacterium]